MNIEKFEKSLWSHENEASIFCVDAMNNRDQEKFNFFLGRRSAYLDILQDLIKEQRLEA